MEGRGVNGDQCTGCKAPNPKFRCADEECVGLGMRCEACVLKAHRYLPFHWLEVCLLIVVPKREPELVML